MSTLTHSVTDTITMTRRNLVRAVRYPTLGFLIAIPVIMLLLFVYVFGGTLGDGLETGGGSTAYLNYVLPGIILMTIGSGPQLSAISVSQDMTSGIIARLRPMAISRSAVMGGHVITATLQLLIAVAVVFGVALLMGFRTSASFIDWLGIAGLVLAISIAFSWFAVALGVIAKSVESASNIPMPIMLLPFLGSGFVPTDSMPGWLSWFAEVQPFTPFIETLRALLEGTEMGANGWISLAWCLVIGVAGWIWAVSQYERRSVRA